MFLPLRTSISSTLLLSFAILLTYATYTGAEDSIKPIPESQSVHQSNCPSCQNSMTADSQGYGYCGNCRNQGRMFTESSWCPPGKIRIRRERVQYWKYYPNYWSGKGPGAPRQYAPMVYTPTDTSQLGFYYQHAPSWTSQPWRIPGAPHPAAWHNKYCGTCNQGGRGYYEHQGGYCPSCQNQPGPAVHPREPQLAPGKAPSPIELPTPSASLQMPRFSSLPEVPPEA